MTVPIKHTHVIQTTARTWHVTAAETEDRIELTLQPSRPGRLGDEQQFEKRMLEILSSFEHAGKPIQMLASGVLMLAAKGPGGGWLWMTPGNAIANG